MPKLRPCIDLVPIPGRLRLITDHDYLTGRSHTIRSFRWGVADEFDQAKAILRVEAEPQHLDDLVPGRGATTQSHSRLTVKVLIQRDTGTMNTTVSAIRISQPHSYKEKHSEQRNVPPWTVNITVANAAHTYYVFRSILYVSGDTDLPLHGSQPLYPPCRLRRLPQLWR
jgi:hypothetical protein